MLRIFFGAKAPHVENKIMFREIYVPSTDVHDIDVLADVLSSGDRFKKCHGSLAQVKAFAKKKKKIHIASPPIRAKQKKAALL